MISNTDYRQKAVADFQVSCKQWDGKTLLPTPTPKTEQDLRDYKLRLKLCIEETFELFEACLTSESYKTFEDTLNIINTNIENLTEEQFDIDPVSVFDSLVDQSYVNDGFANLLGLNMKDGLEEVHKSNMTKLDKDGNPIFREDGKLLKSDLYIPPNLENVYKTTKFIYKGLNTTGE